MPNCASCGAELTRDNLACSSCGALTGSDITRTAVAPTARQTRPPTLNNGPASRSEARFLPGQVLADRYRIIALLGRGGMGEVYRADDLVLGQQVALKFLPDSLSRNSDALARFRSEVRLARQVSHPNVCRVYDVGDIDGHPFLSMEYVDGEDLGSLLRRIGRLPSDKAVEISRKLCAGLAAAHQKGVLHRDLKPGNVMIDGRGQVLLADFGLAALTGEIAGQEIRSGTPAYMAPEQLSGKEVTIRSDIYSLGLVLYELFTGKRPFESDTLAGLIQEQAQATPASPASFVRDLDPQVERVILRCLQPDPAKRPGSALAVAAALPGGDPLAAALAAGETPSPQMVAAAGEGRGLSLRVAVPLFLAVLAGMIAVPVLISRSGALEQMQPEYSPDVLAQKARDIAGRLGYPGRPADHESGFDWDAALSEHISSVDKPSPKWNAVLRQRPSLLSFWYRQSPYPMTGTEFHDDLLTPGIVTEEDPVRTLSGMIDIRLDPQGRLVSFQAAPPQLQQPSSGTPRAPNWDALFAEAGLDRAQFQPAEPLWTWLATSDTRMAWTGTWPDSSRALRVEAATLRGNPVAFALIGPWMKPDRMPIPDNSGGEVKTVLLVGLCIVIIVGGGMVARRNLVQGRGDRRGAARLAGAFALTLFAIWACRVHLVFSLGLAAMFLVAICTAIAWAVIIWTVYLAVEPFVRRYWPQSIISWSSLLTGNIRDPIVGRDILLGAALGLALRVLDSVEGLVEGPATPNFAPTRMLGGLREAIAASLAKIPYGVRGTLIFFFTLFLLRVLLRKQWLAAAAFVVFWTGLNLVGRHGNLTVVTAENALVYSFTAFAIVRLGLLSLVAWVFFTDLLLMPVALQPGAWYFANSVLALAVLVGIASWAFYISIAGHRSWLQ